MRLIFCLIIRAAPLRWPVDFGVELLMASLRGGPPVSLVHSSVQSLQRTLQDADTGVSDLVSLFVLSKLELTPFLRS